MSWRPSRSDAPFPGDQLDDRRQPAEVSAALAAWDRELALNGRVLVPLSKPKLLLALLTMVACTLLGAALIVSMWQDPFTWSQLWGYVIGAILVWYFGFLGLPALLRQLLGGEALVVDRDGVGMSGWRVAWSEVGAVGVLEQSTGRWVPRFLRTSKVILAVTPEAWDRYLASFSPGLRYLGRIEHRASGPVLAVPNTIAARARTLADWLETVRQRAAPPPAAGSGRFPGH